MARAISDSILNAIDVIVESQINRAPFDRTITARILGCSDLVNNGYKIDYQGGTFTAYAEKGASYRLNQLVYVNIPEGDFSSKKNIIGLATVSSEEVTSINAAASNYSVVGETISLSKEGGILSLPVAEEKSRIEWLYRYEEEPSNNLLQIDNISLKNNLMESDAFSLGGTFSSSLAKELRQTREGDFGIICILAFKNEDDSFRYDMYQFNCDKMLGDPYRYSSPSTQTYIFDINDKESFDHVEKIFFYYDNFNVNQTSSLDSNISLSSLNITCLKTISNENGDYSLTISSPGGITVYDIPNEKLKMIANLRQNSVKQELGVSYYWFSRDARINKESSEYNIYAGSGWKKIEQVSNDQIEIPASLCGMYINKFLCVAICSGLVFKTEFSIYNVSKSRVFELNSNGSGNTFPYGVGKVALNCVEISESSESFEYSYLWSKIDDNGVEYIFDKTYQQLSKELEAAQEALDGIDKSDEEAYAYQYNIVEKISAEILNLEGVLVLNDYFEYPVKKINTSATFRCLIFEKQDQKDILVGEAEFKAVVTKNVVPTEHFVMIKNGEQCFQYNEAGISPTSERYQEPQEILPLEAALYSPQGVEIKNEGANKYSVYWLFPTSNTLINLNPNVTKDPQTEKYNLLKSDQCNFTIKDEYDVNAVDNQITCVITYKEKRIVGTTSFSFVKRGEDGTNGTDLIAKIEFLDYNQNPSLEIPFVEFDKDNTPVSLIDKISYISVENFSELSFNPRLFAGNQEIIEKRIFSWKWSTEGKDHNALVISPDDNDKVTIAGKESIDKNFLLYKGKNILQLKASYDGKDIYAHKPVGYVKYLNLKLSDKAEENVLINYFNPIEVNSNKVLKTVLYNKDGRNPIYNSNSGISFSINKKVFGDSPKNISISVVGGKDSLQETAKMSLVDDAGNLVSKIEMSSEDVSDSVFIKIQPHEEYFGDYNNNFILIEVDGIVEIGIPVHFSLNTYGLASLNAWDGNHIEINEEDAYLMAPQIGAGEKNSENKFTGIVMGKASFDSSSEPEVGLFGFKDGRQSIFLDAKTGSATFGLNDSSIESVAKNDLEQEQRCGRIHLNPNGESYISSWRIGRKSLYNINSDSNADLVENNRSYLPKEAIGAIDYKDQGIILGGSPAYMTIKGKGKNEILFPGLDATSDKTVFYHGNSNEVVLSSNTKNVFSVLRHSAELTKYQDYSFEKNDKLSGFLKDELQNPILIYSYDANNSTLTLSWGIGPNDRRPLNVLPVAVNFKASEDLNLNSFDWKFIEVKQDISEVKYKYNNEGLESYDIYIPSVTETSGLAKVASIKDLAVRWTTEQSAGLDEDGNLNANSLSRNNFTLSLGSSDTFGAKKSNRFKGLSLKERSNLEDNVPLWQVFYDSKDSKDRFLSVEHKNKFENNLTVLAKGFYQDICNLNHNTDPLGAGVRIFAGLDNDGFIAGCFNNAIEGAENSCLQELFDSNSFDEEKVFYFYKEDSSKYEIISNKLWKKDEFTQTYSAIEPDIFYYEVEKPKDRKKIDKNIPYCLKYSANNIIVLEDGKPIKIKGADNNDYSLWTNNKESFYSKEIQIKDENGLTKEVPYDVALSKRSSSNFYQVKEDSVYSLAFLTKSSYTSVTDENNLSSRIINSDFEKDSIIIDNKDEKASYFQKIKSDTGAPYKEVEGYNISVIIDEASEENYLIREKTNIQVENYAFWKIDDLKYVYEGNLNLHKNYDSNSITDYDSVFIQVKNSSGDIEYLSLANYTEGKETRTGFSHSSLFITKDVENSIKKEKNISANKLSSYTDSGSFIRLVTNNESAINKIISSDNSFQLKAKTLLLSSPAYSLTKKGQGEGVGFSLSSKYNETQGKWELAAVTPTASSERMWGKGQYEALFSNNKSGSQLEGLFFSGRGRGSGALKDRSALFSSHGLIIQNASGAFYGTKGRFNLGLKSLDPDMVIQSFGGSGILLCAVPTAGGRLSGSELLLSDDGTFKLTSKRGGIRSRFGNFMLRFQEKNTEGKWVWTEEPKKVAYLQASTHLTLSDEQGSYKTLRCGNIFTNGKRISTGAKSGNASDYINKNKGGNIHSRGGKISTNGGDLHLVRGNLRFNNKVSLKAAKDSKTIQASSGATLNINKVEAQTANFSGNITANDFFLTSLSR